jgi:rhodanese-related sulfurtransferase
MRGLLLSLALLGLLAVAGCGVDGGPSAGTVASPRLVAPAEFELALADPNTVAVNVHIPDEGSLEGTELTVPFDAIEARADELPDDRSTPLAVYCMSGRMSAIAVETLAGLGYTNVVELEGGMIAWQEEGRPLLPASGG